MASSLLTETDKTAIAESIKRAEEKTSGEIVFALADASARYDHATLQGSLAFMFVATAIYLAIPIEHTIGLVLWTQLVSFAVCLALLPQMPWRRHFIRKVELDARVKDAAFSEFYASGLYRTKDSNGILIYLSVFERRVYVLGDRGIHAKMGDQHWDEVRNRIIEGIRAGKPREGICSAVEICGGALSQHFARMPDDVDELSNMVIERRVRPDAP